jgi:hypothetical protein
MVASQRRAPQRKRRTKKAGTIHAVPRSSNRSARLVIPNENRLTGAAEETFDSATMVGEITPGHLILGI